MTGAEEADHRPPEPAVRRPPEPAVRRPQAAPVTLALRPGPETLDAVSAACTFLAHVFLRPEAAPQVQGTLDAAAVEAWPLQGTPDAQAGMALLAQVLESPATDSELAADYARLFAGPGAVRACPFESVHRSDEGLTFEQHTLQVRQAYAQFGLVAPALNREPDDHIGLELAFVGELCLAAMHGHETGDGVAADEVLAAVAHFVSDHLLAWGPGFASLVADHATTDLYRAAGLLLRGALTDLRQVFPPA